MAYVWYTSSVRDENMTLTITDTQISVSKAFRGLYPDFKFTFGEDDEDHSLIFKLHKSNGRALTGSGAIQISNLPLSFRYRLSSIEFASKKYSSFKYQIELIDKEELIFKLKLMGDDK